MWEVTGEEPLRIIEKSGKEANLWFIFRVRIDNRQLFDVATTARTHAYRPYSCFGVFSYSKSNSNPNNLEYFGMYDLSI